MFRRDGHAMEDRVEQISFVEPVARGLRLHLMLADGLIHEICHALFMANNQHKPNITSRWVPHSQNSVLQPLRDEPYYRDDRVAELGHAFESVFFSGVLWPIGNLSSTIRHETLYAAPFGAAIYRWPGLFASPLAPERGTAAEFGRISSVLYPVTMKFMHQFSTKSFWDNKVSAQGLLATRPIRWHGVRWLPYGPVSDFMFVEEPETHSPDPPEMDMQGPPPEDVAAAQSVLGTIGHTYNDLSDLMYEY